MNQKSLIIVESPTKAKTISKFIDTKNYQVTSSFGHVRDLPTSKMGVDIEHDFAPEYIVPADKTRVIKELKKLLAQTDTIILATDEDREGEAIAWHLVQALKLNSQIPVKRIAFHEITASAVKEALDSPRDINMRLVDAQQARRVLDRLVGYELSPFLWKNVAMGLSAGRVQSATVRLIVEKEEEIRQFKQQEYWSVKALLDTGPTSGQLRPRLIMAVTQTKEATARPEQSLEPQSASQLVASLYSFKKAAYDRLALKTQAEVEKILSDLKQANYVVKAVDKKTQQRWPQPPFTTSTLQQAANRRFGFTAKQTMFLAQQLYEGIKLGEQGHTGLITYMRTDSVNLASKFLDEARQYITQQIGPDLLPPRPVSYQTKSKGAQEAHEAIRPTTAALSPEQVKPWLDEKMFKLYTLIWQRALASQMKPAVFDSTTIDIAAGPPRQAGAAGDYMLKASGQIIKFAGFMKIYPTESKETILPDVKPGQALSLADLAGRQHFTKPPARYSDASLVKKLEELGIGRPSTYAPIISTIQDRNYVVKDGRYLQPTEMGEIVNQILVKHFPDIVDYNFTAQLEDQLDEIASGQRKWVPVIKDFYDPFKLHLLQKNKQVSKQDLEEATDEKCEKCGQPMIIKVGRFGKFMACTGYPECKNTKPINGDGNPEAEPKSLGQDPDTGLEVLVKTGRFGPYVQLGEKSDTNPKPRRASLKLAKDPKNPDLAESLKLLSLPRTLGEHPEKKEVVMANIGRFGPYVSCAGEYRSVKVPDNVFEISLERAVELLNQPKAAGRNSQKTLKDFDKINGKKTTILDGRYGPYLKHGTKNISLPDEYKNPAKATRLTAEQAVKIIAESKK